VSPFKWAALKRRKPLWELWKYHNWPLRHHNFDAIPDAQGCPCVPMCANGSAYDQCHFSTRQPKKHRNRHWNHLDVTPMLIIIYSSFFHIRSHQCGIPRVGWRCSVLTVDYITPFGLAYLKRWVKLLEFCWYVNPNSIDYILYQNNL